MFGYQIKMVTPELFAKEGIVFSLFPFGVHKIELNLPNEKWTELAYYALDPYYKDYNVSGKINLWIGDYDK